MSQTLCPENWYKFKKVRVFLKMTACISTTNHKALKNIKSFLKT